MPKSANSKMKMLLLLQYLERKTDEEHPASMTELLGFLEQNGVAAERKSIYSDIRSLQELGYDIMMRKGKEGGYFMAARDFELAEIKISDDMRGI